MGQRSQFDVEVVYSTEALDFATWVRLYVAQVVTIDSNRLKRAA